MQPDNDHNVYILGAGFSYDAGIPLLGNFLQTMREAHPWLIEQQRSEEAKAITAVLKFRLESAAAAYWVQMDLENIEELFSLASAYPDEMGRDIRLAIAATIDYAQATAVVNPIRVQFSNDKGRELMGSWGKISPENKDHHLIHPYRMRMARLLGLLKEGKPQGRNTFITFNYDTLVEDNLSALGIPFSYRFDSDEVDFKANVPGNDQDSHVSVLKLHGSVNWAWLPRERKTRVYASYASLRKNKRSPQLIPPTWKKAYQRQFSTMMEEAARLLQTATRVIVIGFSMPATDVHFKYLLAAGFAKNISLTKIWFINPEAELLQQRAKSHFKTKYIRDKRIAFEAKGFAEMASEYGLLVAMGRRGAAQSLYTMHG